MIKHLYKYIAIFIIVIIFASTFIGSHSVQSVDDLGYVVAMGIDTGENDNVKVTFQFTMPNSSGENNAGETAPSVIDTIEADSLNSAMSLMNTFVSKELNLSHCKIVVFSEEKATLGIEKEITALMNNVQIRPDCNIIISTSTAEKYIRSVSPSLENLVAKFYEILPSSSQYTGYTEDIQLGEFYHKLVSSSEEPTAILRKTSI